MNRGSARINLRASDRKYRYGIKKRERESLTGWTQLTRLCTDLHRSKCEYSVRYVFAQEGQLAIAHLEWTATKFSRAKPIRLYHNIATRPATKAAEVFAECGMANV